MICINLLSHMKKSFCLLIASLLLSSSLLHAKGKNEVEVDICIYGGTSAGIIAGYTAAKYGKSVIVVESGSNLGGLTTGGLGATDIGNKYAITGLARNFYQRIGAHYSKLEQWTFEPHVAMKVFQQYIDEVQLDVRTEKQLSKVLTEKGRIKQIVLQSPASSDKLTVKAKVFIDCSYEGDLMAKSGVSYTVGRESNATYGETYNGVQLLDIHQFSDGIDPYVERGKPESGLLWGISQESVQVDGSADNKVQAYNFRLTLTKDKNNKIGFTKPDNYDPDQFELLLRVIENEKWPSIHSKLRTEKRADGSLVRYHTGGFLIKNMPNGKTDFNNFGAFSTDMIGANYDYPEADYEKRREIYKKHENYTKGLLYFLSHEPRVPEHLRKEMGEWGFCKDEFLKTSGFSDQLYIREARRMVGRTVMTQKHCEGESVVQDGIGMAAYQMDSHNCQRIVVNGMVKNEGDVQVEVGQPYPISYAAITPKKQECENLLVPVCLSASHIAFGSIRMEPVFMVLSQSAAVAAVHAIDAMKSVQEIDVSKLQLELNQNPLADGTLPELLIDNADLSPVDIIGDWTSASYGYGKDRLISDRQNVSASVKFRPKIGKRKQGFEIYTYIANDDQLADTLHYTVFDGATMHYRQVQPKEIKRLGDSSGEWVSLGTYTLIGNESPYVQISATEGKHVVADAILFKKVN